jgi:5-oxoprolinase (ATP-hydrolysing) subunit A
MPVMDLNADLAEGSGLGPVDRELLGVVTSASLACGFHAGDANLMRAAAEACVERGVAIGAHVSYRDRDGFGRRVLDVPADRLAADVVEQWEALATEVTAVGGRITYVKPHGALYHRMATDLDVATTVVDALAPRCHVLVGPPGGALEGPAMAAGLAVVPEGFCDRGYTAGGLLVPRGEPGDLLDDPEAAAGQARSLATGGGVTAVDGTWVALTVRTLCIHGDRPRAGGFATSVRRALGAAGVELRSFAADDQGPHGPSGRGG